MTKEQFLDKWLFSSNPLLEADLEAVIANEIAKAQKAKPQFALNPIEQAYEMGEKIRCKDWQTNCWIKKHSKVHSIDEKNEVYKNYSIDFDFDDNPEEWELYTEPAEQVTDQVTDQEQPSHNPIAEAYERGEKIRYKLWYKDCWIKKHTESLAICDKGGVDLVKELTFTTHPQKWELYTEPAEQPAKPFDKERFERMFCSVVESGENTDIDYSIKVAENALKQLDAYYATKEGGANG